MNQIMEFFAYEHLPPKLQTVSKPICDVARVMDEMLPDGPEKSAGLRKLLEAKDCLVRASIGKEINEQASMRTVLHITVGDDDWEPSSVDLSVVTELFMNAKCDPKGSVVATRQGIVVNALRITGDTEVQVVEVPVDREKAEELLSASRAGAPGVGNDKGDPVCDVK